MNAKSLEHLLLRILVEGPDLATLAANFCSDAVTMWWSDRQRRLVQGKRVYTKRKAQGTKRQRFSNEFIKDFLANESDSENDD